MIPMMFMATKYQMLLSLACSIGNSDNSSLQLGRFHDRLIWLCGDSTNPAICLTKSANLKDVSNP